MLEWVYERVYEDKPMISTIERGRKGYMNDSHHFLLLTSCCSIYSKFIHLGHHDPEMVGTYL